MGKLVHRTRKSDANQSDIVKAFRLCGWSVKPTHMIGKGFPDLVCGKMGRNILVEVKDGSLPPSKRKLTEDEEQFWAEWRGSILLIETVDDVMAYDRKHWGTK